MIASMIQLRKRPVWVGKRPEEIELSLQEKPHCVCDRDSGICDGCSNVWEIRIESPSIFRGQDLLIQTPPLMLAETYCSRTIRTERSENLCSLLSAIHSKMVIAFLKRKWGTSTFPKSSATEFPMEAHADFWIKRENGYEFADESLEKGRIVRLILKLEEDRWMVMQGTYEKKK